MIPAMPPLMILGSNLQEKKKIITEIDIYHAGGNNKQQIILNRNSRITSMKFLRDVMEYRHTKIIKTTHYRMYFKVI
jgi:hypothetical protein